MGSANRGPYQGFFGCTSDRVSILTPYLALRLHAFQHEGTSVSCLRECAYFGFRAHATFKPANSFVQNMVMF